MEELIFGESNFAPERFVSHGLALEIFKNCRAVLLLPSKGDKKKYILGAKWLESSRKGPECLFQ